MLMLELQCSVSKIEQFRKYIHEAYNGYIKIEDVIKTIKGEQVYKPAMVLGTAYHALIEGVEQGITEDASGYTIKTPDMPESVFITHDLARSAMQYRERHKLMTHEVKVSKTYILPGISVTVNGRVDGLHIADVHDAKTTERPPTYDDWSENYQWRYYLDMLGAKRFFFDFFIFQKRNGEVVGVKTTTIPFASYESITEDCTAMLSHFIDFCKTNGLMDYLKLRQKDLEAKNV